jgi:uncharacterized protein YfaS (alpha-2-macroglobulin family)
MIGRPHRSRYAFLALAALLVLSAALGLGLSGGDALTLRVVEAGPVGEAIGLLEPVRIRFDRAVPPGAAEAAVRITPPVPGRFTWAGTTLEFRPDRPGYARAMTYRVTVGGAPALTFRTVGDLRVQRRFPADGESGVATDAAILVQFTVPVVPVTTLQAATGAPVLRIEPPVAGAGTWLTSSMYRFRPADGWQGSTTYTVTILPSLTGLGGEPLTGPTAWSFTTVLPAVADVSPAPMTTQAPTMPQPPRPGEPPRPPGPNLNFAPATAEIVIRFNQPVDRAAAERAVSFRPPITGTFTWPDDTTLVLRPEAPLQRNTPYSGTVAAGIPAANGGGVSPSEFTWSFTTAGLAGVASTDPAQGATAAQGGNVTIRFNTPMDKPSVEERITVTPRPDNGPFFFWEPGDLNLHVNFLSQPSTDYTVTLAAGAKDRFDQVIENPFVLSFRTAPLTPSLTVLGSFGGTGVFMAGGSSRAVLSSVNLATTELTLYRIDETTFAAQAADVRRLTAPPPGATELRRWQQPLTEGRLNQRVLTVVDLDGEAPLETGYYLLWSGGPSPMTTSYQMFVVTRTHLTLKRSATELTVWALDYATGTPVADLPLRAFTQSGRETDHARTDAQGLATLRIPPPERGPFENPYVVGEREGDAVFASTGWLVTGGFPYLRDLIGSLTTDRPIYRPGETVYYQGVLRVDDDAKLSVPPRDPGAVLIITDTRGRELLRTPIMLDEFGSFYGDIKLDAEAQSGFYFIRAERQATRESFLFQQFQVAEFRRPDFAVTVTPDRQNYVNGETITVTVSGRLFFGAPVPDAPVRWRVTTLPYSFSPPDFPTYIFSDLDPRNGSGREVFGTRYEGRGRTNAQGTYTFAVPADVSGDPISQTFTIEATVTDANNQEVSNSTNVRVHKAALYAGVRPRQYVSNAGLPFGVDFVTVDITGKPVGGVALTVQLVLRRYHTVQVRDPDGEQRFQSTPDDRLIETRTLRTGADGRGELTFTPQEGGLFRIVAAGQDGAGNEFRSAGIVYVTAAGFVPWLITNDDRLSPVADKNEYAIGDVARVLVPAPFAGAVGLVSIERQGVIARQVRTFESNSVVLEIPIERVYLPNVYVSVSLFRPPTDENPVPEFRSGFVELKVSTAAEKLTIALTPDKPVLGPRETVTFAIKVTDAEGKGVPAELSLALVDEAILSLSDVPPANAFTVLYGQRGLGVQTAASNAVSLDVVAERARALQEEGGKGGGGGGGEDGARADFRFTADWQPALRTDADGNASLSVRMPDTLTTWRLTARAITVNSLAGMAETTIVTTKPLIVRPVTPRFFTAGDRPNLGAVVNNLTDTPLSVQVTLSGEGIALEGGATRSVQVDPGKEGVVAFSVTVPDAGTARVTWAAAGGGHSDAVRLSIPIYPLTTPEVTASAGAVTDRVTEVIRVPAQTADRPSRVDLDLWPSLIAALPETVRFLRDYPFESAEVTASRILTTIGLARAQGKTPDRGDLATWISRLYAGQRTDGGWGWWRTNPSDPAITAYVVLALVAARDLPTSVDADALNKAAGYLGAELDRTRPATAPLNPETRALMVYALASVTDRELGRVFALAERRDTLGPEGKALLALAMEQAGVRPDDPRLAPLLTDLVSSARLSAAGASWDDPVAGPARLTTAVRTTAFALWALAGADPNQPLVDGAVRWLMTERRQGRWASTQESAIAVLALGAVARAQGGADASYTYRVTLDERALRNDLVPRAGDAPADRLVITDGLHAGDNQLVISRDPATAPGRLYYQLSYQYTVPAQNVAALDHGVAVAREFLTEDGSRRVTSVKAGDLVMVRVTVLASGTMSYVMLEDFLPAGLEAIDITLATTSAEIAERLRQEAERQARLKGATCRVNFRPCRSPFTQTDIRDDRVVAFAAALPQGEHEFVYFARATTAGSYAVRPSRVQETYFPDVWGRTDSGVFVVEE